MLSDNATILFQGDSITDANRHRDEVCSAQPNCPPALGVGYAGLIASQMLLDHPHRGLRFFNRGISGNRVTDLYARWRRDALLLEPDIISILIGINDIWHGFSRNDGVSPQRFADIFRILLEDTRAAAPACRLVLGQPFALPIGAVTADWAEPVRRYAAIVAELALAFDAVLVPYPTAFATALESAPATYWTTDGVHPTAAGHALMARCWSEAIGLA